MIFDRITVRNLEDSRKQTRFAAGLGLISESEVPQLLSDLNWLFEKGIVFELSAETRKLVFPNNEKYQETFKAFSDQVDDLERVEQCAHEVTGRLRSLKEVHPEPDVTEANALRDIILEEIYKPVKAACDYAARLDAIRLRESALIDAYPLINDFASPEKTQTTKSEVIKLVINALPVPSETTPWEHILEYRSDPDSRARFLDLRNWMSEVAKGELQPIEIEQKLEHLISTYERHLKLHRMKVNTGTLQTIVTTSAEVLGDLISFKWGKAAEALFAFKHRHVALMEAELNSPGSEIAYIVKTRERFS